MVKFDFRGKNFLVTGATSGIGHQVVVDIQDAGGNVFGIGRNKLILEEMKNLYKDKFAFASVDLKDLNKIENFHELFINFSHFDGIVHAAGINKLTPLRVASLETCQEIINTNVISFYFLIKSLVKKGKLNEGSSIIFLSSVAAIKSNRALSFYAASKGAINSLAISLSLELAPKKIRCNIISPGWVRTQMSERMEGALPGGLTEIEKAHPLGIGEPKDISSMVMYLLSNASKWVTGSNFMIDGGYHIT